MSKFCNTDWDFENLKTLVKVRGSEVFKMMLIYEVSSCSKWNTAAPLVLVQDFVISIIFTAQFQAYFHCSEF